MTNIHEEIQITKTNSFWIRGDDTENRESIQSNDQITIAHPLYLTGDIQYAVQYSIEHGNELSRTHKPKGRSIVKVYELKLSSRKDIHTKICDLTSPFDLYALGYPNEMVDMFKRIEIYYSFSRAAYYMDKREHIPVELTLAVNFIYFKNKILNLGYDPDKSKEKNMLKTYPQLKAHETFVEILRENSYIFPDTISQQDITTMCTAFSGAYNKNVFSQLFDINSVIGYLKTFKMFHDNFPNKYRKIDIANSVDYVDFLSRYLFNDIYERGYCGYFCPEKNKSSDIRWIKSTEKTDHFPCIALFDDTLIAKVHVFDAFEFKQAVEKVYLSSNENDKLLYAKIRENPRQNDGMRAAVELMLKQQKTKHNQIKRNQRIMRRAARRRAAELEKLSKTKGYVWNNPDGKLNVGLADMFIKIKNACRWSHYGIKFNYKLANDILSEYRSRSLIEFNTLLTALSGNANLYICSTVETYSKKLVFCAFVIGNDKQLAKRFYVERVPKRFQISTCQHSIAESVRDTPAFRLLLKNLSLQIFDSTAD